MLVPRSPRSSSLTPDDMQLLDKSYLLNSSPGKKQPRILDTQSTSFRWLEDGLNPPITKMPQSQWPSESTPPGFSFSPTLLQFVEPLGRGSCASTYRHSTFPIPGRLLPSEDVSHSFTHPSPPSSRSSKKRSSSYTDDNRFEYDLMLPIPVRQMTPKRRRLSVRQPCGGSRVGTPIKNSSLPDNISEHSESVTLVDEETPLHVEVTQQTQSPLQSKSTLHQFSHSGAIHSSPSSSISSLNNKEHRSHNQLFPLDISPASSLHTFTGPRISNGPSPSGKTTSKQAVASKKYRVAAARHCRRFKLSASKTHSESHLIKKAKSKTAFLVKLCNQLGKVY